MKLVPMAVYRRAGIAIFSSLLMIVAEFAFALLLQGYIYKLGFISKDSVSELIRPILDGGFFLYSVVIVLLFKGLANFLQTYINIAFGCHSFGLC